MYLFSIIQKGIGFYLFYKCAVFFIRIAPSSDEFIHKLSTNNKKTRHSYLWCVRFGTTNRYFTATASISTNAPIGSFATS